MRLKVSFESPLVVIHKQAGGPGTAAFTFQSGALKVTGEHMSSTMQAGTHATVVVTWKDFLGKPVEVDGPTTWTSSDEKMVVVSTDPKDSKTGHLTAVGPTGKCVVHANADADMGSGVVPVTSSIDIEVIAGQAQSGDIVFTPDTGAPPKGTPPGDAKGGSASGLRR